MKKELSSFAARLRGMIPIWQLASGHQGCDDEFNALALELFTLQFKGNPVYGKICAARGLTPGVVEHWTQVPGVPASAFKELELSCIPPDERTAVFHSSGTMDQKPSRHFHCGESLAVYEASLWPWFAANCQAPIADPGCAGGLAEASCQLLILTPPPSQAPHSSLVHMFETVRQHLSSADVPAGASPFFGRVGSDGVWSLDIKAVLATLNLHPPSATGHPLLILGTAFSFVHLLDFLTQKQLRWELPRGSRVMETGGYKNRSRDLPKAELHALITERLGIGRENILCEYGMSELSSQAYDVPPERRAPPRHDANPLERAGSETGAPNPVGAGSWKQAGAVPGAPIDRVFRFPPWARVQIISPETGREAADGEDGLIRIFDLANVFSVAAIQTEDLGIRRGQGFELIGRAQRAEPRGCSLMTA